MKNHINRMVEKVIDIPKLILIKREFNSLLIGVFLCLFIIGGVSPLYAGWYTANVDNQSNVAWGDFHFEIYEIPGHAGNPLFDISKVVFDMSGLLIPSSSQTLDSINLSGNGKELSFNFYNDPYAAGATGGWWKAHINNPDGVVHGVTYYPSVVPEPVSSTLFILGGVTLGFRRYLKNKRKSKKL